MIKNIISLALLTLAVAAVAGPKPAPKHQKAKMSCCYPGSPCCKTGCCTK